MRFVIDQVGFELSAEINGPRLRNVHLSAPEDMAHFMQQHNWWRSPRRAPPNVEALSIRDYFRSWLARFKLGAHFLDLSCLLFELRRENLHLFLLQRDSRFQVSDTGLLFLDFFVLLEELVEQHHGHLLVVHAQGLTVPVTAKSGQASATSSAIRPNAIGCAELVSFLIR